MCGTASFYMSKGTEGLFSAVPGGLLEVAEESRVTELNIKKLSLMWAEPMPLGTLCV